MFDSANSKNVFDPNPNRRLMSSKNSVTFNNLKKAQSVFNVAVKECHNKKLSTPLSFTGIIWRTTVILELYQ